MTGRSLVCGCGMLLMVAFPRAALAQSEWIVWEADDVQSVCGVVNTPTLEFVVRTCDKALVLVSGDDVGYSNTLVSDDGEVFIDGIFSGFISFEEDADGFFTLWWVDDEGFAIDFDDVSAEPFLTSDVAADYENVPCAVEGDHVGDESLWGADADCAQPFGSEQMLPIQVSSGEGGRGPGTGTCGIGSVTLSLCGYLGLMWVSRQRRL